MNKHKDDAATKHRGAGNLWLFVVSYEENKEEPNLENVGKSDKSGERVGSHFPPVVWEGSLTGEQCLSSFLFAVVTKFTRKNYRDNNWTTGQVQYMGSPLHMRPVYIVLTTQVSPHHRLNLLDQPRICLHLYLPLSSCN